MVPIIPDWPAPAAIRAAFTTREGGVSSGPHAGLNLGRNCGDDPAAVAENRRLLAEHLSLPAAPEWLRQVHGTRVLELPNQRLEPEADGVFTTQANVVCAVQSADCLAVLFCDEDASVVAAAHAGWRGLCAGVLESTVAALPVAPERLMAWIGPAIGPEAFEVGAEVRTAFVAVDPAATSCFQHGVQPDKYYGDLFALARQRLARAGVTSVYGGGISTHADPGRFYSFRRDGVCGRMAALIWIDGAAS
ncbi:peptidoglycan editing factor PgeF [Nevskia ramosa]|uniref:peptidoglycan editing factor PgeF n=1 Tax=Nevskia ramosa TaxID=64002 RepID=UPI002352C4D1|nr:peptidoglycan editing factor PgeF [Nevskia ramosa]